MLMPNDDTFLLGIVLLVAIFIAKPLPAGEVIKREGRKNQPSREGRQHIHSESAGHAHCRCRPERCGGR